MPKSPDEKPWRFKPGNPGRPHGAIGGRHKALNALDEMVNKEPNIKKLQAHWQKLFDKNPAGFWLKFVVPLLPKGVNIGLEDAGSQLSRALYLALIEYANKDRPEGD